MQDLAEKYAREPVWAVVGASNQRGKYGNRIYRTLRSSGYTVYPINLGEPMVEGDPAYSRLANLPQSPTVVNIVVPPRHALEPVQ
jgi:uncharacterized protein